MSRANTLEALAKTRHPAAKSVTQTPAKQEVTKKRSCNADKPTSICTNEEEDASLHKGASALAALRNGPTKKQRSAKGPRALSLRPISGALAARAAPRCPPALPRRLAGHCASEQKSSALVPGPKKQKFEIHGWALFCEN